MDLPTRPEKCAESGEELSHSCQTFGGTIPASGAHCRRGDLSHALGLTSWLECDHFWKYRLVGLKSVRPLKEKVNWRPAGMTDARLISGGLSHPSRRLRIQITARNCARKVVGLLRSECFAPCGKARSGSRQGNRCAR